MNEISHFSVRVDDLPRAQKFYTNVFGWQFEPWGPPGFFLIHTDDTGNAIHGDMHLRETPLSGDGICAFECTISVSDIDTVIDGIKENGGTIVYEKATINGVGDVVRFKDPEGNFLCAMKYETR